MAYTLTTNQRFVASEIERAGHDVHASNEAILATIAAAIPESGLDPTKVGDSGAAYGILQQHPSYGDVATRTNPYSAAKAFLTQFMGENPSLPIGQRIADIQRPREDLRGIYSTPTNLDNALSVFNQVNGSAYTGDITGATERTDAFGNVIGIVGAQAPGAQGSVPTSDGAAAGIDTSAGSTDAVTGVLASLDAALNVKGGIGDKLNPINQGKVLVARTAVIGAGGIMAIFGLILITQSVGQGRTAQAVKQTATKAAEVAAIG